MRGDLILLNGTPQKFGFDMSPDELLGEPFVHHHITVFGRRVVGGMFEQDAVRVLDINGYPTGGGAVVSVFVWSGMRMASVARQLPWREFSHTAGLCEAPREWPLLAVVEGRRDCVVAMPFADTIQRRLCIEACRADGLTVEERALGEDEPLEELFAATPSGISSVTEYGGALLPHSLAARIVRAMNLLLIRNEE